MQFLLQSSAGVIRMHASGMMEWSIRVKESAAIKRKESTCAPDMPPQGGLLGAESPHRENLHGR
jgi:hypothetical protein